MKKSILLLSLLFSATSPMVAGQDVGIVVNIENNTYQNGTSNDGNIDLGAVGVGNFTGNISVESYHPDGRKSTVTIQDCTLQSIGNVLNQPHINFRTLSSVVATGSNQIFVNENNAGAKNVGIVMLSVWDPASTFNVLSTTDNSHSAYPVMSSTLNNSSWKFSTRMQKIDPALNVISDPLIGHALVDIYYE